MRFEGTLDIAAPRDRVSWFTTDTGQVTACAPDLRSREVTGPHHFEVVVRPGVGPIKTTFSMNVQFLELERPKHAAVLARGQAPGSAVQMVSNMNLAEFDETHTMMEWSSEVTVSGMIQQVGARLIQGAADKITQQLFACIKTKPETSVPTG